MTSTSDMHQFPRLKRKPVRVSKLSKQTPPEVVHFIHKNPDSVSRKHPSLLNEPRLLWCSCKGSNLEKKILMNERKEFKTELFERFHQFVRPDGLSCPEVEFQIS